MAKPNQTNPQSNSFLACFRVSGKKNSSENPIKNHSKNKSSLLSWSMFCFSFKKSPTKTVPVDNSDKGDYGCESKTTSKLVKKKLSDSDPQSLTNHNKPSRQNSKADRQSSSLNKASRAKPKEGDESNIVLGNGKLLDPTRTGSSLPVTPTVKPKTNPKTHSKLSHSVSLPVLQGNQRTGNPRINDRLNSTQHNRRRNNGVVEKLDPLMGFSIIMVTLVIMLLWGRLCAILCTSAWFYFRLRFRSVIDDNNNNIESIMDSNDLNLNSNSEEYKKKIVLEGLLERNRKVTL